MTRVNRRVFCATAAGAMRVRGANERVRLGLIGCGGRGAYVTRFMLDTGNAEVGALCDVYQRKAEAARTWAGKADLYGDYRRLVESRELDAVVVATPDHWHALAAAAALEAGKAVYVEKPFAHNVREGQALVRAAARSKALLLAGTQQRSAEHYAEAGELIRSGLIGAVTLVRVWNYSNMLPNGIGTAADGPAPEGLNWEMYCGPAPLRPFNPKRLGPTYRWFRDYAGGTITDFGVHRFDTVHQLMGDPAGPVRISATGGRFRLRDAGEMPDTLAAQYEYPGWVMTYEMSNLNAHGQGRLSPEQRYYNARGANDRPHGEAYHGTQGTIIADRLGYEVWFEGDAQPSRRRAGRDATARHAAHFLACIRGTEKPRAPALTAHRATNVAHLGNIAYEAGLRLNWDAEREVLAESSARARLGRAPRAPWDAIK